MNLCLRLHHIIFSAHVQRFRGVLCSSTDVLGNQGQLDCVAVVPFPYDARGPKGTAPSPASDLPLEGF